MPDFAQAQGITPSAPLNVGIGSMAIAGSTWGTTQLTDGPEVVGISAFLNIMAQWIKMPRWFDQNRWIYPALLVLGLVAALVVFNGDHAKALVNGSLGALKALTDYRAWKATGLGGLPPA